MTKIHQYTIMCVPIMGQMASIEALKNGHKSVEEMKKEYKRRREFIVDGLNDLGLECHKPQGAFYVFPNITQTGMSSQQFADLMLNEAGVAICPGNYFGESGEGYVRLCYANSLENIKKGMAPMEATNDAITRGAPEKLIEQPKPPALKPDKEGRYSWEGNEWTWTKKKGWSLSK
jgi:aminotransferase